MSARVDRDADRQDYRRTPGEESVSELLKALVQETGQLVKAEAQVMKLEVKAEVRDMMADMVKAIVFAGMALLGVLALTAFAIIALGDLLLNVTGDATNAWWLSALAIGLLFTTVGGGLAVKYARDIGRGRELELTRAEIERTRAFIEAEKRVFTEAVTP